MKIRISAYGDLKFYTPGKTGIAEVTLHEPAMLSEILKSAGIPTEYVGAITIDKITVDFDALISSDAVINIYPMVSGG